MTSQASIEHSAYDILSAFSEFKLRAGQSLSLANIKMVLHEQGRGESDHYEAFQYAARKGWIRPRKHACVYCLTTDGQQAIVGAREAAVAA